MPTRARPLRNESICPVSERAPRLVHTSDLMQNDAPHIVQRRNDTPIETKEQRHDRHAFGDASLDMRAVHHRKEEV
jgi:hypothetical protein